MTDDMKTFFTTTVCQTNNDVFQGTIRNDALLYATDQSQNIYIGASNALNTLVVGSTVTTTSNMTITGKFEAANVMSSGAVTANTFILGSSPLSTTTSVNTITSGETVSLTQGGSVSCTVTIPQSVAGILFWQAGDPVDASVCAIGTMSYMYDSLSTPVYLQKGKYVNYPTFTKTGNVITCTITNTAPAQLLGHSFGVKLKMIPTILS